MNPNGSPREKSAWERLSERERSILKLIAEGNTNRSAGEFLCISAKTVEKHRASLMRKLSLHNASELVLTAIDMGVVERPAGIAWRRATPPSDAPAGDGPVDARPSTESGVRVEQRRTPRYA